MNSVVVMQVRSTSSRLPGKAFLSIAGIPLAVLAAKRAANTGLRVICATSDRQSDDYLSEMLAQHKLEVFRGDLHDVLARFVAATAEFEDSDLVYRLTADNVFPDGCFISEIGKMLLDEGLDYFSSMAPGSSLPYGLSVEVTRIGHLRAAAAGATNRNDREHVTAVLQRQFGHHEYRAPENLHEPQLRCTVDTLADYLLVAHVFGDLADPIHVSVEMLVNRLKEAHKNRIDDVQGLIMGGAQIGQEYGITRTRGSLGSRDSHRLLECALERGIVEFDTAPAYGGSEEIIGAVCSQSMHAVRVTTKLSTLDECPEDAEESTVRSLVRSSVYQSLFRLKRSAIDCLLLHRFQNLNRWNGCVLDELKELLKNGLILELGVSVQTPTELLETIKIPCMSHAQVPFNILDHRWSVAINEVSKEKSRRDFGVYVRSVFLQGLLLSSDEELWRAAGCETPKPIIKWLHNAATSLYRADVADLCLAFVRAHDWVDGVILGMNTTEEMNANIALMHAEPLSIRDVAELVDSRPTLSEMTLNPANWVLQ